MKDIKKVLSKAAPHINKFLNQLDKEVTLKFELHIGQSKGGTKNANTTNNA